MTEISTFSFNVPQNVSMDEFVANSIKMLLLRKKQEKRYNKFCWLKRVTIHNSERRSVDFSKIRKSCLTLQRSNLTSRLIDHLRTIPFPPTTIKSVINRLLSIIIPDSTFFIYSHEVGLCRHLDYQY